MGQKRLTSNIPGRRANRIALALVPVLSLMPILFDRIGLLSRTTTPIEKAGNGLYIAGLCLIVLYVSLRIRRAARKKSLTGIWSAQGFASVLIGASGLLLLGLAAPLFPEQTIGVYLAGAGIVVLFASIPLALFQYVATKLDVRDFPDRSDSRHEPVHKQ